MAVAIELKGKLEPALVDETFTSFVQQLNKSIAQGNMIAAFDGMHGNHVAINIPQILTIEEYEE